MIFVLYALIAVIAAITFVTWMCTHAVGFAIAAAAMCILQVVILMELEFCDDELEGGNADA